MANQQRDPGLELALLKAGGVRALARLVGRTSATVSVWTRVPVDHVLRIEEATGVSRQELRPDIYPPMPPSREQRS